MSACGYVYRQTLMSLYIYVFMHKCMYIHAHITYIHEYIHVYVHMHICTDVHRQTCMVYMCVCTYIYVQITHIHLMYTCM